MSTITKPKLLVDDGFAFAMPDLSPEELLTILSSPPRSCVATTAFYLVRRLPREVYKVFEAMVELTRKRPSLESRDVMQLWNNVAQELGESMEDHFVETIIRWECAVRANSGPFPVKVVRDILFHQYPERETPDTRRTMAFDSINQIYKTCLADESRQLRLGHPKWTEQQVHEEAVRGAIAELGFSRIVARAFKLKASPWKPRDDFDSFRKILRENGPMIVAGPYGLTYYESAPEHHPISILGMTTVHWSKSAKQISVVEGVNEVHHAVLVIGAALVDKVALVYFRDINDLRRVFTISYKKLQNTVLGHPLIAPEIDLSPENFAYVQDSQEFGYHHPKWTISPTTL